MASNSAIFWFRRDLRLTDNAALFTALNHHERVVCVFIFDPTILTPLPRDDRRVAFIWRSLSSLKRRLRAHGSDLVVAVDHPAAAICRLARTFGVSAVYAAEDYEPDARTRDAAVDEALSAQGSRLELIQDHVLFARDQLLTRTGRPYTVFTPYKRAWLAQLSPEAWQPWQSHALLHKLCPLKEHPLPTLPELGFANTDLEPLGWFAEEDDAQHALAVFATRIDQYHQQRDFPALNGTSRLSPHLRFGTLSIRAAIALASETSGPGASAWLNELIWREFYQQLLWHFPHAAETSFRSAYRQLPFPNRQDWFDAWREGRTGYPLVDAAMRQLRQTGWMHNRLRMVTASFLVKDLLIDWRWGERHFARWLMDFDLAANNGGWQWAASTGCDAQPWFRIFNPVTQSKRFDPDGQFIRQFVPELAPCSNKDIHAPWLSHRLPGHYPPPLVDHARQREEALTLFQQRP